MRHPWSDGTTHLDFAPHELIGRLAAFVPRPRVNLVLYHGVFAPNAKQRRAVVSYGSGAEPAPTAENAAARPKASPPRYWAWSDLLSLLSPCSEAPGSSHRARVPSPS
ncbi:MAG TPA: hypothetical protein ENK57_26135 [Polyangiaceae bacterium]|nr:hypothetical protein [Polyangiaceae bacterium]